MRMKLEKTILKRNKLIASTVCMDHSISLVCCQVSINNFSLSFCFFLCSYKSWSPKAPAEPFIY